MVISLVAGDQACVLQALVDGEWKALDFAPYVLREPTPDLAGEVKAIPNAVKKGESLVCTDVVRIFTLIVINARAL
jgi:hypothetical protein